MEITTIGFIQTDYGHAAVQTAAYQSGGALAVMQNDSTSEVPIATLSVNLREAAHDLGPGEFFAKTWSENAEVARLALASGLFEDTGRRIPTGYVEAQVWRIVEPNKKDAYDAGLVQSACNPSGVVRSFIKLLESGMGPSAPVAVIFACKIGDMAIQYGDNPTRHTTWASVLQLAQSAATEMANAIATGTADTAQLRKLASFQLLAKELRAWTQCDQPAVMNCAQKRISEAVECTVTT